MSDTMYKLSRHTLGLHFSAMKSFSELSWTCFVHLLKRMNVIIIYQHTNPTSLSYDKNPSLLKGHTIWIHVHAGFFENRPRYFYINFAVFHLLTGKYLENSSSTTDKSIFWLWSTIYSVLAMELWKLCYVVLWILNVFLLVIN